MSMLRRVVFSALPLALAASASADDLWQRAVALAAASEDWHPGEGLIRSETLDGDGKLKNVEEVQYVYRTAPGGSVAGEIVKAVKDGRDVTTKRRERESRQGMGIDSGEHPFAPSVQESVSAQATSETQIIAGETCARYDYTLKTKDATQKGRAWLSQRDGAPLLIEYSPDPLPSHVDRMQVSLRYESAGPGQWLLREIVTEGAASMLFIKRGFRTTASFAKHRRRDAESAR